MAGVVGAATNNNLGIASLGWNTIVRPYNYNNSTGSASDIISAVNSGANVLNCSWRTVTIDPNDNTKYINYDDSNIRNAIQNAITLGRIVVASAGNPPGPIQFSDGITRNPSQYPPFLQYPAANIGVIAVSATNSLDQFPSGYNYGSHVDLCAPSIAILTTGVGNSYPVVDGTSFGAPLVAALSSLILSVNSSFTGTQVANILETSSDDLGTVGRDDYFGFGRINALSTVAKAYTLTNPDYTYATNFAPITLYQQNVWKTFDCIPAPGISPGMYLVDIYKIETSSSNYAEIFNGWYLGQYGYYPGSPITCQPYLYRNIENNQLTLRTFYYFIKKDIGLGNVNVWAPLDPTSNNSRKYSVLGKPLVAPMIANITQNPVPIYKGTSGYATVNLSQGNGTINYNWFSTDQPSYVTISPSGNSCQITYLNVASIPGDAPSWDFGCTVTNPAFPGWSDTERFFPSLNSDPNGCPTLAFEQNRNLVDENTLLVTSISNPDKDVTDYYLINAPLTPINDRINLTVHEPQTEHSWFDQFSLIEARVNPGENIAVNDEGQIINYKGILPARILLNGETDITPNLLELDSLSVELNPGDKLTISRNAVEGDGDVVLGGEEPIIAKDRPSLIMNILTESKVEDSEEIKTESIPITNFFLRPNKSIISKRLRNLPTGTIEITVNKKLTLDYFVFVSDLRTARTRELPLVSAVHNVNGDVKTKLTGIDQNYSEMYPTERIDLSFSTTINSGNRAYILKTVGRYETDTTFVAKQNNLAKLNEQPIIPTENKLYDNYPNPFNPSTIIKYSLKDGGRVSLKIFNSLGEEVRTLVNEIKAAGIYEIEFNATNLPSGVYIYQLTTPGFTQARKMILAK